MPVTALVPPGPLVGNADFASRARKAIGCVHSSLLVTDQYVLNRVLFVERVVDIQNSAAWVTPDLFHALGL